MVESTVPMLVREEDRLMAVSCDALAGAPLASCSWTKMALYTVLSASTLVGPMKIPSLEGVAADTARLLLPAEISKQAKIRRVNAVAKIIFFNMHFSLFGCCFRSILF